METETITITTLSFTELRNLIAQFLEPEKITDFTIDMEGSNFLKVATNYRLDADDNEEFYPVIEFLDENNIFQGCRMSRYKVEFLLAEMAWRGAAPKSDYLVK